MLFGVGCIRVAIRRCSQTVRNTMIKNNDNGVVQDWRKRGFQQKGFVRPLMATVLTLSLSASAIAVVGGSKLNSGNSSDLLPDHVYQRAGFICNSPVGDASKRRGHSAGKSQAGEHSRICSSREILSVDDELSNFDKLNRSSGGLAVDSGDDYGRFQGDVDRLKRSTNEEEYVEYLLAGAITDVDFSTYYWSGDAPQDAPFKVAVSKSGLEESFEAVSLSQSVVGDSVDGWIKVDFSAGQIPDGYDYIRVSFPVISDWNNVWHPQLGRVALQYYAQDLGADNTTGDIDYPPVGGGQAALPVSEEIQILMAQNNIETQFDWYVTRGTGEERSNKLFDDGLQEYRFASFNLPNMNITEDPYWGVKNEWETEDGLKTIAAMGGKVARVYTLSIFNADNPTRLPVHVNIDEGGELVFNEDLFVAMDKMLAYANKHGVRVIVPFVDRSNWWGGVNQLAAFRGKSGSEFYSDLQVKEDYKQIVSFVLNRVNTVTGVAYKDDPAVFAWETGNELRAVTDEWTMEMAEHIKAIDNKHLLMDGKEVNLSHESLNSPMIDVVTNHYYGGGYADRFLKDWKTVAGRKPFVVGETGLVSDLTDIQGIVDEVVVQGATGIMLWSLRTQDAYGGFRDHSDDPHHAYHWPGFLENELAYGEQTILDFMWTAAYSINDELRPALPAPDGQPELLPIFTTSDIRWKGVTSAQYYDIERSETPSDDGSWVLVGDDIEVGGTGDEHWFLTDRIDWTGTLHSQVRTQLLFQDMSARPGVTYHYRVKGINLSGESNWSNIESVVSTGLTDGLFEDPLDTLTLVSRVLDPGNLVVDTGNAEYFGEEQDAGRIKHYTNKEDYLEYAFGGEINSFWLETFFWRGSGEEDVANFSVQLSKDGEEGSWEDYSGYAVTIGKIGDWEQISLTGGTFGKAYKKLRVVFPKANSDGNAWAQQLGSVKVGVGSIALNIPVDRKAAEKMTLIEDFESYASTADMTAIWSSYIALTPSLELSAGKRVKLDYDFAGNGYSGFENVFKDDAGNPVSYDWSDAYALKFWLEPDGSDNILTLQFKEADGDHWEAYTVMSPGQQAGEVIIPLSDFHMPHWGSTPSQVLNPNRIGFLKIFINQSIDGVLNSSTSETGIIYLDNLELVP